MAASADVKNEAVSPFLQSDRERRLTAEDNKECCKAYGKCLDSEESILMVSCTGEVDDGDTANLPFDYVLYQSYRQFKKEFQKWEQFRRIANNLPVEQADDLLTNEIISTKMQLEFGPMDTFSKLYKGYLESYRKATLHKMVVRPKKENLKYSKEILKTKQEKIKSDMNMLLKKYPSFKSFREVLRFEYVDWFVFPRPNFARINVQNTSFIEKVIAEGYRVISGIKNPHEDDSDLTVAVLPDTKTNPLNLVFLDPMISFPSEILYDQEKISDKEARQLKSVMIYFPNGVTVDEYLSTYNFNYGADPNYVPFGTFVNMCESLVDIFQFSDEIVSGRRLLFPAYWTGLLKPMNTIKAKLWHCIKFVINFSGGSIHCDEILPKLIEFFELDINPLDWGFRCDEDFFCNIITDMCPQEYYSLSYEQNTKRYKIFNNKPSETKIDPYLELANEPLISRVTTG